MGETVQVTSKDGAFAAYVARPAGGAAGAKAPAIVVIQEIFGVNAFVRNVADRLASEGFLCIAPDLFWRIEPGVDITDKSQAEWDKAFALYNAFDVDKGVGDIDLALEHIRADPGCNGKVGAVGFCLGGLLAFLTATRTDADACVGYYGVGIETHLAEADKLAEPLMLHIAEEDGFVPKQAQTMIKQALGNHREVTLHSYPGRDHAFAREGGEHYDAADAAKANERTLAFFRKRLG